MISLGRPNTRDTSRHLNLSIVRFRPTAAIEAHRLSGRKGRNAVTDRRSNDSEEVPESGRCAAISRRRFRPGLCESRLGGLGN